VAGSKDGRHRDEGTQHHNHVLAARAIDAGSRIFPEPKYKPLDTKRVTRPAGANLLKREALNHKSNSVSLPTECLDDSVPRLMLTA
jgi:hypothetical protein